MPQLFRVFDFDKAWFDKVFAEGRGHAGMSAARDSLAGKESGGGVEHRIIGSGDSHAIEALLKIALDLEFDLGLGHHVASGSILP